MRLATLLATSLLAVGCGCSDKGRAGAPGRPEGRERRPRAEAPPGSDVEAVEPLVETLLEDYDRFVNQIIAEPSIAAHRGDPLVLAYVDLHEPGSAFAEGALDAWEESAAAGLSIEPYDEAHPALTTRRDGPLQPVSDDEVIVPVCEMHRRRVSENGRPTEGTPLLEEAAEVTAVRVDDEWLLEERVARDDIVGCATERD